MYYPFKEIEKKWQNYWEENESFKASDDFSKPKYYVLIEFPYPSGQGLHVGHPRSLTGMDVIARKRRMEGYNVLFPVGWDAFGLPTENYAINQNIHPRICTDKNISNFKRQMKMLGFSFDWSREIDTSNPDYYKWTQLIFIKLFNKGLAYKTKIPVNWCTSCNVGLANEEVINGKCERCGSSVIKKNRTQWMLKITDYADRLIEDLESLDFIERVKSQQINWIGRSYGAEIDFQIKDRDKKVTVYTTRPETIFGATYLVISLEHPIINELSNIIKNYEKICEYKKIAESKSDIERAKLSKEKTGIEIEGIKAINPATKKPMTIWVADYVLMTYGTGAIMSVPAHDERDFEFAKKYNLQIKQVIKFTNSDEIPNSTKNSGVMINSGFLNRLNVKNAFDKTIDWIKTNKIGKDKVNYKLRDWVFSRQRYWGEPIPIVYCKKCGWITIPESELPLVLPNIKEFKPTKNGESLLSFLDEWLNTKCPKCGGKAKRETDTMPQWAGSSWYFLRYTDPNNEKEIASKDKLKYWMPVDWYNGGMEHTTLHLLYSRFWNKFLYDEGITPYSEPYKKRTSHGNVLGKNRERMSKSRGNVINPDIIVEKYGADTFRVYEMFMGSFEQETSWSMNGINGIFKFINKIWNLSDKITNISTNYEQEKLINKTIKNVNNRIENIKFNTAISEIMSYTNILSSMKNIPKKMFEVLCIILYPFAPHITSEIWKKFIDKNKNIINQKWLKHSEEFITEEVIPIPIQINGKLRDVINIKQGSSKKEVFSIAEMSKKIKSYINKKKVKKIIFVKDKILNIIV